MLNDSTLPQENSLPFGALSHEVRRAAANFGMNEETPIQTQAIPAILNGDNVLLIAPTGSGKTEAAMMPIFHMIGTKPELGTIKVLYITPLRALNRDMLGRLERWAQALGLQVQVRHGDTPQNIRRQQALNPPDILVTTPETLQAILIGSRLRASLSKLKFVVIDEIHNLASDRRGSQLSIGLERLAELVEAKSFQRIGLSATVKNKSEVANFLCGSDRNCTIVDASGIEKASKYYVEFVEPTSEDDLRSRELFVTSQTMAHLNRISDLIASHERTLLFVNSRNNAELISSRFQMIGVAAAVHHGSLPREERERVERDFKNGRIRCMVCTSTLELGIDIGDVDLVVQYMSPRQVNSLIQRVGRSGHSLSKSSEGVILGVSPEDLLESIVISIQAKERNLEPVVVHDAPLDVLAHQVAGFLMEKNEVALNGILAVIRRAYPYRLLTMNQLTSVTDYMQKLGYIGDSDGMIYRRNKCRVYYLQNLSMIPDERRYNVIDLGSNEKVGILGEEFMMIRAKIGLHFIVKGRIWQIENMQEDNVYVTPVEDPTAAVPGWDGELLPTPQGVSMLVGEQRSLVESQLRSLEASQTPNLKSVWPCDRSSRDAIVREMNVQTEKSAVPSNTRIVVEKYDRFIVLHTSSGDRINLTLGELFEEILLREGLVRSWWNDGYRILFELTTEEFDVNDLARKLFRCDDSTEGFLKGVIRKHFPFGYYMKFIAERFGALKRGLMLSGDALKELTVKFRFTPIYDETLREAELTKIDIPGSLELLRSCKEGRIEVVCLESIKEPSPLAKYIMNRYAEYEYADSASSGNTVESMRSAIAKEVASLLCFNCSGLQEFVRVGDLDETPSCPTCGSHLLAVLFYGARYAQQVLNKKKESKSDLSGEEADFLSKVRRSADLVLSYGKKGAIAQCVYGVGPQTASKVLSKMHSTDEAFYNDLLQAKLKFIQTKPFWD